MNDLRLDIYSEEGKQKICHVKDIMNVRDSMLLIHHVFIKLKCKIKA